MRFPHTILLALGCVACRTAVPPAGAPAAEVSGACALERAVTPRDTIVVGSSEAIDATGLVRPSTGVQQMVFDALYETLIGVDCEGGIVPRLAASWSAEMGGRQWTFTLRDSARFSDGSPAAAAHVIESWADDPRSDRSAASLMATAGATATADSNRITISFQDPHPTPPRLLAHPAFAVRRQLPGNAWPMGTGPYRVDSQSLNAARGASATLRLLPVHTGGGPVIELHTSAASDARDLLDAGVDVVLTSVPAAIAYAATRPELAVHPLPWDRTYAILSSSRRPGTATPEDLAALGDLFARDAIRTDARGARSSAWWRDLPTCRVATPDGAVRTAALPRSRIVYAHDDSVARELAARIVAVAAFGSQRSQEATLLGAALPELVTSGRMLSAVGLAPAELAVSLRAAFDRAYVVSLPSDPTAPCVALQELIDRAPLVSLAIEREAAEPALASSFRLEEALVPVVETRSHLIVRRGAVDIELGANGGVRLGVRQTQRRVIP
ncbi:MAG TPA: ABC transporter substrate-binding protein [Gemmatimonadaceae bacterium]|nr:ABC transporter substrate-binding protein [Gemmatimonadaceae bacterium]